MNITLIGMAGVGKSFIGKRLAKRLNYRFIDIDGIIEEKTGLGLQQIIDKLGNNEFLKIEEKTILELGKVNNCIISLGGSSIYLEEAMEFLKKNSIVIFLNDSFENIRNKITNKDTRGIIGLKNKDLKTLFNERLILYKKYADVTVEVDNTDTVISNIIKKVFV